MEHVIDHNADVIFVTETWLKSDRKKITSEIQNYGYRLKHCIRKDDFKDRGGGVGIIVRSSLSVTQISNKSFTSFEHVIVKLQCTRKQTLLFIAIYRLQYVPITVFYDEFPELLEMYTVSNDNFVIAGDINIHVETDEAPSRKFHEIIDIFDLKQHVSGPTHIKGHTIDVVITRNNKSTVDNVVITKYNLSHHFLIDFVFNAELSESITKTITYRNVKKVDCLKFRNDIQDTLSDLPHSNNMKEKITNYNNAMTTVLNKHAPVITKTIRIVPHAPWFDAEYADLRRKRRKAERRFRKTGNEEHENEYNKLRNQTTLLAQSKKKSYINDKLSSNNSSKNMYAVVNKSLDNTMNQYFLLLILISL